MKAKVVCGRKPTVEKTKIEINSWHGNRGVIVSSAGRRSSLILLALQLIARKIQGKE